MSLTARDGEKRISFIDQCKGIGILLMIRGHCATVDWEAKVYGVHAFRSWIYSFHMPLFFLLGGCLLAYKQEALLFPKNIKKKASTLLLPGLYFSFFMITMHFAIKLIAGSDYYTFLKENISSVLTGEFYNAMWFLGCYFGAEILFLLLMKKRMVELQPMLISAVFFIGAISIKPETHIMVRLSRLMMAICFLGLGYWCYEHIFSKLILPDYRYDTKTNWKKTSIHFSTIWGGVLLVLLGAIGQAFNGKVSMVDAAYGNSGVLFLLYALLGSFGLIFLSIGMEKSLPVIEYYGKNSLIVLCTHLVYIELFWIFNSQIFHVALGNIDARLFALGIIIIEAPTIVVINKYFPWLMGIRRKNQRQ